MNMLSFLKEFLKKGEIPPRSARPPNRASSLPFEQPLRLTSGSARVSVFWNHVGFFKQVVSVSLAMDVVTFSLTNLSSVTHSSKISLSSTIMPS